MEKRISTFHCTAEQVRILLQIGIDEGPPKPKAGPDLSSRLKGLSIGRQPADSVLLKILSGSASVEELASIRSNVAKVRSSGLAGAHTTVLAVLYQLANAAAIANHSVHLSGRPRKEILDVLQDLLSNYREEPQVADLLRRALSRM